MPACGRYLCWLILACAPLPGCAVPPYCACDRGVVADQLTERTGYDLADSVGVRETRLPNGTALSDGLTEEEAVLIALWNNAAFQETLTELEVAEGDLIQAGLLPNPEVVYFFPVNDKPYKYALEVPLEALWLRPIRVAAAERESGRVCQNVTQAGLSLMRDTRQAYADALLARGRVTVADEAVELRQRIAKLAAARLEAGDATPQEVSIAQIDVRLAEQDRARLEYEIDVADERLRNQLGIGDDRTTLKLAANKTPRIALPDADALAQHAASSRPDILAAEEALAAAAERVRLAETSWFRVLGILDATSGRRSGHEFGPGLRVTLPIFHANEGVIWRSDSELERAVRQRQTVYDRIILEVHTAHARYAQASAELALLDERVQPEVETAISRAESAYREGDSPYIVVLEASRQLLESRVRREQLEADLRRAWAELERSVGRHLDVE